VILYVLQRRVDTVREFRGRCGVAMEFREDFARRLGGECREHVVGIVAIDTDDPRVVVLDRGGVGLGGQKRHY